MNEPKFKTGDKLWFMRNNKAQSMCVYATLNVRESYYYDFGRGFLVLEDTLFPTKEDLIASL